MPPAGPAFRAPTWDQTKPPVLYIMLNPSVADELADDTTITRCIRRAEILGAGGIIVMNLFAWITPYRSILPAMWSDLRYVLRSLRRQPSFAATALLTFARHGGGARRDCAPLSLPRGFPQTRILALR